MKGENNMNEILFYGGMVGTAIFLLLGIVFFVLYYMRGIKLRYDFDKEYGERDYIKKGNKNEA